MAVTEGTAEVIPEEDKLLGTGGVTVMVTTTVVGPPQEVTNVETVMKFTPLKLETHWVIFKW